MPSPQASVGCRGRASAAARRGALSRRCMRSTRRPAPRARGAAVRRARRCRRRSPAAGRAALPCCAARRRGGPPRHLRRWAWRRPGPPAPGDRRAPGHHRRRWTRARRRTGTREGGRSGSRALQDADPSDSASIPESRSGRTARTAAISRTTCASGASRMSTSAWPRISMLRTTRANPIASATAEPLERWSRHRAQLGASAARKTWRRSSISSVASCCGPQPPARSTLSATSTWPTSPSANASSTAASSGRAASAEPEATTWSSAESASRADPRPRRTAASSASSSTWSPASSLTDSSRLCSVSAPRSRNSRCWVRLRMVAAPSAGRSWPGRRRRGSGAPPTSSATRWRQPSRACGPRRRCTPSSVPGYPGRHGPPGRALRPRRCWTPHRARAR